MSLDNDASAYAPESPGRPPVLYEVTAVAAATCTVKPVYDPAQVLVDAGERDDVVFLTASAPSAGDTGMLLALSNGNVVFFAGGGGGGASVYIAKATQAMAVDDTGYTGTYLNADGSTGSAVTLRRPPGVAVAQNSLGIVVQSEDGKNILVPLHIYDEPRTSDPGSPLTGQRWYRTDL